MKITKITRPLVKQNKNYYNNCILNVDCGEQVLPVGGACLLGSLNLTQFINKNNNNWDYDKIEKLMPIIVRFMDNVNDLTYVPLESQKEEIQNKRRIGIGIMGYASSLVIMGIKYGSDKALKLTEQLMKHIANNAYKSSSLLAKEKGSFKLFNKEQYLKSNFLKVLDDSTIESIRQNGIRNSHLLSIQPTGNTSNFINIVSSGLEPIFLPKYKRTSIVSFIPDGLLIPKNIDWANKTYTSNEGQEWKWIKEGDENLLKYDFNGIIYKIDKNRGLLKESIVTDYAVKYLESKNINISEVDYISTIETLNIDEHINTMKVITKYIDAATSKTINIPNNYSYDDFKSVYMKLHDSKTIKGGTTYRMGTMAEVLSSTNNKDITEIQIKINEAPKRPKELKTDVIRFTNNKEQWIGFIGLLDNQPYEIFTGRFNDFPVPSYVEKGIVSKIKDNGHGSRYDFTYIDKDGFEVIMQGLNRVFDRECWNYAKFLSALLRHGTPLKYIAKIVEGLKFENDVENIMLNWKKGVMRIIKKYIKDGEESSEKCPECGSKLIYKEGCVACPNCPFSKCG